MSILKTIGDKITKAEQGISKAKKKYADLKKEAKPITRAATKTFDYILPPLKKKKSKTKRTKIKKTTVKLCPCRRNKIWQPMQ